MLKTLNLKRPYAHARELADRWLDDGTDDLAAYSDVERPKTRGDCVSGPRPCPFVGCRYNNYLDVSPRGSIKFNFPDREPWEMPADASYALDVADRYPGGAPLPVVQAAMGLSYGGTFKVFALALKSAREPAAEIVEAPWAETGRHRDK